MSDHREPLRGVVALEEQQQHAQRIFATSFQTALDGCSQWTLSGRSSREVEEAVTLSQSTRMLIEILGRAPWSRGRYR